jgi:hypothetical protein
MLRDPQHPRAPDLDRLGALVRHSMGMEVDAVPVEGYHEVLALHRFLFECKLDDLTSVYVGSPFIAAVQRRLADALEAADSGTRWATWRAAERHVHRVELLRRHLAEAGRWWKEMSRERRGAYVQDVLAPLRLPAQLLAELVEIEGEPMSMSDGPADSIDGV